MQTGFVKAALPLALFPIAAAAQQASVVTVNPQIAARSSVVTVTPTAPPKDAKIVQVMLDAVAISVPTIDPNGNYRVQIPDAKPNTPGFVPLGKHRVSVNVDDRLFTGNEYLDVERLEPAPILTSLSPTYLVRGSAATSLILTGENFATSLPQDNQILFDEVVQPITWDGCSQPKASKPQQNLAAHGEVVDRSTIKLMTATSRVHGEPSRLA